MFSKQCARTAVAVGAVLALATACSHGDAAQPPETHSSQAAAAPAVPAPVSPTPPPAVAPPPLCLPHVAHADGGANAAQQPARRRGLVRARRTGHLPQGVR